jgi:hypothetical protein
MKSPVLSFTAAVPTPAETTGAIARLSTERDTYKKAAIAASLESERLADLKRQGAFNAGFQWAYAADYEDLKDVEGPAWLARSQFSSPRTGLNRAMVPMPIYGDPNGSEFQAGAKAFFLQLPKD